MVYEWLGQAIWRGKALCRALRRTLCNFPIGSSHPMYGHLQGHSQQRETVSRTALIPFRNWLCCSKNLVFFQLILLSGDWEPSWNHKNPTCQSSCSSFGESLPPSVVLAPLLSEIVLSSLLRAPPVSQSGHSRAAPAWPSITWFWCWDSMPLGLCAHTVALLWHHDEQCDKILRIQNKVFFVHNVCQGPGQQISPMVKKTK